MDYDNDGLKDLVAGDSPGNVWFFRNIGTAKQPKLADGVKLEAGGKPIVGTPPNYERGADGQYRFVPNADAIMGVYSKIHVTDWDLDGKLDLLIGQDSPRSAQSNVVFYRNVGTAKEPRLAAPVELNVIQGSVSRPSPYVVDWDGDGKRDLLLGTEQNKVLFLRNAGTNQRPRFEAPQPIPLPGFDATCYRSRIAVTDWNNDGKLDLLVGTFYSQNGRGGNVWLFLRK